MVFLKTFLLSLLIHIFIISPLLLQEKEQSRQLPVKVKIIRKPIVEAPLPPTEKPREGRRGLNDHKAKKPKKVKKQNKEKNKPQTYGGFLPSSKDLVEKIDEEVEDGEVLDLNTTEYKYISYFVHLKRSIQAVWIYPAEAQRKGWRGTVIIRFTILKGGKVILIRVISSSGRKMLDDAAVQALKDASPFNPIPDNYEKDKLTINGAFVYR